ncbi:MAG: transposase [Clostridia bacterium]|nr:transposase [Clostridia bacterium]
MTSGSVRRRVARHSKTMGLIRKRRQKAPSVPVPQTSPGYRDVHRREPTSSSYPSGLTNRKWEVLEPLRAKVKNLRRRKPVYPQRDMLNAIFCFARTGCQWRHDRTPHDHRIRPADTQDRRWSLARNSGGTHPLRVSQIFMG